MDYVPPEQVSPPSHLECVVALDDSPKFVLASYFPNSFERVKQDAFEYMNQLHGWCSPQKAFTLMDLIFKDKPDLIVEIGVWGGKSLVPMAVALKENQKGIIYGIDPWDNQASIQGIENPDNLHFWTYVDHEAIMQGLIQKIDQFNLEDQVVLLQCTSEDAEPIEEIDILHIDGNHSQETSFFDVQKWVPLVRKGGWIILDDMTWSENGTPTTARAVAWLDAHCIKFAQFFDTCDWGIWVKP